MSLPAPNLDDRRFQDLVDDAKRLVRELSGDSRADADPAFRVERVSYSYMLFDALNSGGG